MDTPGTTSSDDLGGEPTIGRSKMAIQKSSNNLIDMFAMDGVDDQLIEHVNNGLEDDEDDSALEEHGSTFSEGHPSSGSSHGYHQWVDSIPEAEIEVRVPPFDPGEEYKLFDGRVDRILRERKSRGASLYFTKLKSGYTEEYSHEDLLSTPGGARALKAFESVETPQESSDSDVNMVSTRPAHVRRPRQQGFVDPMELDISSDEFGSTGSRNSPRLRLTQPRKDYSEGSTSEAESSSDDLIQTERSRGRPKGRPAKQVAIRESRRETRRSGSVVNYIDQLKYSSESSDGDGFRPGLLGKRKRSFGPTRRSERSGRALGNMREVYEDDIPDATARNKGAPKILGAKESFLQLPRNDDFRLRHLVVCDTCNEYGDSREKGALIYCQGCTFAYHVSCLGVRKGRAHLATKIGKGDFVLQCRRCIETSSKNEPTAPHQGRCQSCHKPGAACAPFQDRKTAKQEQEEREENNGEDPVVLVRSELINNVKNVLFRCTTCFQAFHFHHLPPRKEALFEIDDDTQKADKRFKEYSEDWTCHDCRSMKAAVGGLIAWRPKNPESFAIGMGVDDMVEDDKEYLIKWHNKSYNQSEWMPGPWVWGVTHKSMRIAFSRRDDGQCLPKMRTEDAIPEEYLRIDIVFQVEYNNIVQDTIEEVDLARITEVERAQVKFKGLGYEDTVWERPPDPVQDPERWADFKIAYEDWVRGQYLKPTPASTLSTHLRKVKSLNFQEQVVLKEQPKSLSGGELMDYQLEGLNWIYYQWHRAHNAILADEMGLGKTIQVIGFMATLVEKFNYWPFLVVVPNATCANWRREIKQWAPNLRVVTYFGSAKARELAEKHELFPGDNKKELRCHVVVTSYDAAQDQSCQRILKRINWAALIVDEGQRLKSDKNILYGALSMLKAPFKLLLTGTPLQNNQRELFNLLQFLDSSINAEEMEKKYENLNKDAVNELHDMLRPFFLRRTKAQVLKFLPTMAQVIVPVTMSPLQKQLYKSILGKNADLLKSIFGGERRYTAKGGLRNILMQLRKCLCHPFVYSIAIEERSTEAAISHRRLVEASSKLQLLEIMLPKLQERGHRVLIFSQFLDMLTLVEDFLQGLAMEHIRLDGTMGSLEKQKCIDKFNAPDSSIFAFLLSTRAGGVGINLATADTVIILDPDFNPHQDIQAISRAHRIGQKKKVLIFQMMTRGSAEEKIMQIGKRKMALDHVLIESMEDDDPDGNDLEDVLRFGAEALFKDDGSTDIHYDLTSIDKLLDRSQVEDTKTGNDDSAESQFSFARIWQNDTGSMQENLGTSEGEPSNHNSTVWDAILAERARQHEHEAKIKEAMLGRGKRNRKNVDYHGQIIEQNQDDLNSVFGSENDTDFKERDGSEHDDSASSDDGSVDNANLAEELKGPQPRPSRGQFPSNKKQRFQRAVVPTAPPPRPDIPMPESVVQCPACNRLHKRGSCPLKVAGVEHCNLCGEAHYGFQRTCPQLGSERAVRDMLEALKNSPEDQRLKEKAKTALQGIKGNIVAKKRNDAIKRAGGLKDTDSNRAQQQAQQPRFGPQPQQVQTQQWRQAPGGQRPGYQYPYNPQPTNGPNPTLQFGGVQPHYNWPSGTPSAGAYPYTTPYGYGQYPPQTQPSQPQPMSGTSQGKTNTANGTGRGHPGQNGTNRNQPIDLDGAGGGRNGHH